MMHTYLAMLFFFFTSKLPVDLILEVSVHRAV